MKQHLHNLSNKLAVDESTENPKAIWIKTLKVTALVAVIVASFFSIIFKAHVVPFIEREVFPEIVATWPDNDTVIVNKEDGVMTASGKPIVLNFKEDKAIINPALDVVTPEDFKKMEVGALVTKTHIYFDEEKDKIKDISLAESLKDFDEDIVINDQTLESYFNEALSYATKGTLMILFVGTIMLFIYFFLCILIASLFIGAIIYFLTKLLPRKHYMNVSFSFHHIFLIMMLFISADGIFLVTLLLALNWLFREHMNMFKKAE